MRNHEFNTVKTILDVLGREECEEWMANNTRKELHDLCVVGLQLYDKKNEL